MIKRLLARGLVIALMALVPFVGAKADLLSSRAYGTETIAGYASALKTSLLKPGQAVVFVVERPDGSVVKVPAEADPSGVAKADLFGQQTRLAGMYRVAVVLGAEYSPQTSFVVYPDQVSATQSTLSATRQMLSADGKENTFAGITLYDAYRNPIPQHAVKLVSSRSEDVIEAQNAGVTDEQGRVYFKVSSLYPGVSVFSAVDLSQNVLLSDREEVVFAASIPRGVGGTSVTTNLLGADLLAQNEASLAATAGPIHRFDIQGLASTVKVGTDLTVTVTARDQNGNTAKNYTGTVLFSAPEDENAVLPSSGEYTFKESDQGTFTFNLALRFSKTGKQTLQIFDKANWQIAGEVSIEVVSDESAVPAATTSKVAIKSPADGAELGSSTVVITGQGEANINLKIFDNDTKIGDSETDGDGFFSFQASNLSSGTHRFYIMTDAGEVSKSVNVMVDTLPPAVNLFEVTPDGPVTPGETLFFRLESEPELETAKIRLQGIEQFLTPSAGQPGVYETSLAAPATAGQFGVDLVLVDALTNKTEVLNQAVLKVQAPAPVPPLKVEGVTGAAGDSQVALSWKAPEAATGGQPVAQYRISYGTDFAALDKTLDTQDTSTRAVVTGLVNGKQYFFALRAVDVKGVASAEPSVTVAVTPQGPAMPVAPAASAPGFWSLSGLLQSGTASVSWNAPVPATAFKVYFGLKSGIYDDYVFAASAARSVTVQDLLPGVSYYFRVAGLDAAGRETLGLSEELSLVSGLGGPFRPAAPSPLATPYTPPLSGSLERLPSTEKTGPEALGVAFLALALSSLLYLHKRHLLSR